MARKLAVVSQKGGVGKTTTAVNLSVALALRGHRVLLIDCDEQGDASTHLGLRALLEAEATGLFTTAELLLPRSATSGPQSFEPQRDVLLRGLDVVPANHRLLDVERRLGAAPSSSSRFHGLARAVATVERDYSFIITDCPPTICAIARSAVVACRDILVPVQLAPGSLRAVSNIFILLEGLRSRHGAHIAPLGFLGTFYRENSGHNPKQSLVALRRALGTLAFDTVIHDSQDVAGAVNGLPIVLKHPRARGAREHQALADEVLARPSTSAVSPKEGASR